MAKWHILISKLKTFGENAWLTLGAMIIMILFLKEKDVRDE